MSSDHRMPSDKARRDSGAALVEYALLVAVVGVGLLGGLLVLNGALGGTFSGQSGTLAAGPTVQPLGGTGGGDSSGDDEGDDPGSSDDEEDESGDGGDDGGDPPSGPDFSTLEMTATSNRSSGTWSITLNISIEGADDGETLLTWEWSRPNGATGDGTLSCTLVDGTCTVTSPSFNTNENPVTVSLISIAGELVPPGTGGATLTVSR